LIRPYLKYQIMSVMTTYKTKIPPVVKKKVAKKKG